MTNNTAIQETDKMKRQWAKHIELGVSMNKIDLIIYALELARNEIHDPTLWTDKVDKALAAAHELKALAQPEQIDALPPTGEQEPVAWITPDGEGFRMRLEPPTDDVPLGWKALYTTPPKPWVGLHLDDIPETFVGDWSFLHGARWAAAKLKEKNT